MKVLVLADDDNDLRVGHILSSEPTVEVAYLGKARSATLSRVTDASGFQVVIGRTTAALELAASVGAAAVIADQVDESPAPTVCGASLLGAGLAMAARLESEGTEVTRVAIAHPGGPTLGGIRVDFPRPVGRASGTVLVEEPVQLIAADAPSGWSAIMVGGAVNEQAVVDEHPFLAAICLAAGLALIPPAGVVRVWDSPAVYLSRAEAMGLVAAGRSNEV